MIDLLLLCYHAPQKGIYLDFYALQMLHLFIVLFISDCSNILNYGNANCYIIYTEASLSRCNGSSIAIQTVGYWVTGVSDIMMKYSSVRGLITGY